MQQSYTEIATVCAQCGGDIPKPKTRKRFCSVRCTNAYGREIAHERNERFGLNSGNSGALSELIVCADLLSCGYEVFRALSPACSCDIIAQKGDRIVRIEVRTGNLNRDNESFSCAIKPSDRFDVLAVVVKNQAIYFPPLTESTAPYRPNNTVTLALRARNII